MSPLHPSLWTLIRHYDRVYPIYNKIQLLTIGICTVAIVLPIQIVFTDIDALMYHAKSSIVDLSVILFVLACTFGAAKMHYNMICAYREMISRAYNERPSE